MHDYLCIGATLVDSLVDLMDASFKVAITIYRDLSPPLPWIYNPDDLEMSPKGQLEIGSFSLAILVLVSSKFHVASPILLVKTNMER